MRSTWKGTLSMALLSVPVTAAKGTDDYEAGGLRRLCSCHHKPFNRPKDECEGGLHPESEAAIKRGEDNLTPVVYGVETGEDTYEVIDPDTLEEIAEATEIKGLSIDTIIPMEQVPTHLFEGFYYLRPDTKVKGSAKPFALLHRGLAEADCVAVTYWQSRGVVRLVVIHPVGDTLVMSFIPFRAQVREPDDACIDHASESVSDAEVALAVDLIEGLKGDLAYGTFIDEGAERREKAIEAALGGQSIPKMEPDAVEADTGQDLMAALQASIDQTKAGAAA